MTWLDTDQATYGVKAMSGTDEGSEPEKINFVPTTVVPAESSGEKKRYKIKPEYLPFYEANRALVARLLATPVSDDDALYSFSPRWAHYFVSGNFQHFHENIDRLFQALQKAFFAPSYPSRDCLGALYRGEPLSLFEIVRLHLAFEHIRTKSTDVQLKKLLHRGIDAPLIGSGSVIPSMHFVDPDRLRDRRVQANLKERDVVRLASSYLGTTLPQTLVDEYLMKGERRGDSKQLRPYRITEALAVALCFAFMEEPNARSADVKMLKEEAASLFPPNPRVGGGNGQYTVSLSRSRGNQVRPV